MTAKSPVVISFYTLGTPYEEEARQLRASCQHLNIECLIEGVPSRGSWIQNCAFKPLFILQKIRELKRPVVWVDADARFKAIPRWENFSEYDLAVRLNSHFPKEHRAYLATGTLFINPTQASLQLLEEWQTACEGPCNNDQLEMVACWDQVILARLLEKRTDVHIGTLPLSYAKVTLWDEGIVSDEETIIEHDLASRRAPACALIDEQKKEFQERKRVWGLSGIVDYHPSMWHKAGDCCLSFIPFIRAFVVIMNAASCHSEEERHQFALLARLFPFGRFIELSFACTLASRLAFAALFTNQYARYFLALSAEHIVDTDQMVTFLMRQEFSNLIMREGAAQLPTFFSKTSIESSPSFFTCKAEEVLFHPWYEKKDHVNFLQHPCQESRMQGHPPNLTRIDEKQFERIEVARHLGIGLEISQL